MAVTRKEAKKFLFLEILCCIGSGRQLVTAGNQLLLRPLWSSWKISDCSKRCVKFSLSNIDHIYVQEFYGKMWGETNKAFQVDVLFLKVLF